VQYPVVGSELPQVTDRAWGLSSKWIYKQHVSGERNFFVCIIILEGFRLNYCVEQKTFFAVSSINVL
jgi:hypothetical protein